MELVEAAGPVAGVGGDRVGHYVAVHIHEAIRGEPLDPGNFRKKFLRMIEDGHIEAARGKRATASKPASVYRFSRNKT